VVIIVTMTATFNAQTLPFHTEFAIAGTRCLLSTNSAEVLRVATFSGADPTHRCGSFFEMEAMVRAELDRDHNRAPHFRGLRHIVFAHLPPRSFLTYDLLRKRIHALVSMEAARDRSFWHGLLLPITIGVLGTTIGIAPLHCACLDRDGAGILIAGLSGAGKSTLAAALAQNGFAFVSDDWTYLSKSESWLVAHGLFSPAKLLPDAVRFFPELRPCHPKPAFNGELAYEIDPQERLGATVKTASVPRSVFFLERVSSPGCSMIPCGPEYLRDFFEKSSERLPDELSEARAFRTDIIRVLSECPCWILRTGESPQTTAEALAEFVTEKKYATA
jgi:hypothetical protein